MLYISLAFYLLNKFLYYLLEILKHKIFLQSFQNLDVALLKD